MTTIKKGDKMVDKHGQEVTVVGFDRDYAGITMVITTRLRRQNEVTETSNILAKILGISNKAGDVLKRAFYPEDLS